MQGIHCLPSLEGKAVERLVEFAHVNRNRKPFQIVFVVFIFSLKNLKGNQTKNDPHEFQMGVGLAPKAKRILLPVFHQFVFVFVQQINQNAIFALFIRKQNDIHCQVLKWFDFLQLIDN